MTVSHNARSASPLISILVPVMNEEVAIPEFIAAIAGLLGNHHRYEILFVDDGSTDGTLTVLKAVNADNSRIRYLSFARNFGKEIATTAALDHAQGDVVIPMDVDLQDPPELILPMLEQWRAGADVVLAKRKDRGQDSWFKRTSAGWYYRFMRAGAGVDLPENVGDFRLMDASVVAVIRQMKERTRFMKGILSWPGFRTAVVEYNRPARADGSTRWNYRKLWKLALDGLFSFSELPLKIWTYIGAGIALFAMLYAGWIIVRTMLHGVDVPGYASLMTMVLFMGGIQLISLGVIGEYVARIYNETKQRPLYVVREKSLSNDD